MRGSTSGSRGRSSVLILKEAKMLKSLDMNYVSGNGFLMYVHNIKPKKFFSRPL